MGVPIDEPAVAAARADHLAAKAAVYGAAAPVAIAASPVAAYSAAPAIAAAPVSYAAAPAIAAAPVAYSAGYSYAPAYGYQGPLNLNTQLIAHPNGAVVPVDEPAVAAARADHLVAKGQAYAAAAPVVAQVAAPVAQVAYTAAPVAQVAYAAAPVAAPVAPIAAPVATYGYAGPLNLTPSLLLTQMELLSQLMSPLLLLPVLTTLPPREFMEESMPMLDQLFMPLDMPVSSPSPMELLSQLMSQPLPLPVQITLLPLLLLTK